MRKLNRDFYDRNSIEVGKSLLGKYLVRKVKGEELIGKIVEVEAYMGPEDKAAHSYGGRRTERNEVMYREAGFTYVYFIYGMYYCMNVVVEKVGIPQAVLIRALEPISGTEKMCELRYGEKCSELNKTKIKNLTNGPGKLCKALGITREQNGEDLCGDNLYIMEAEGEQIFNTVHSKRINIDYAEEAKDYLWRFYIEGNPHVSKK
jgi:DNA-3-methyladenine glycosylase